MLFPVYWNHPVCACLQNTGNFVSQTHLTPLKLCGYFDHVLNFCKTQFSTVYSFWFKNYLSLNLEIFVELTLCQRPGGSIIVKSHSEGFFLGGGGRVVCHINSISVI